MNNFTKTVSSGGDIRTFLKNQHRKAYSICRLFTNNYREQQQLFINMLAAVSHSITGMRADKDRSSLMLKACINMVALHSISMRLEETAKREIEFKSPDYQRTMVQFRESLGEISDYEKIRLFLKLEGVEPDQIASLTGSKPKKAAPAKAPKVQFGRSFIPFLKQMLVWS